VCGRINAHDDDLKRRTVLYEALRARGVFLKDIAEVAGVTSNAVGFILDKAEKERAGTWSRAPRKSGRRTRKSK
jgi:predicted ArsR family transcriptional regulator